MTTSERHIPHIRDIFSSPTIPSPWPPLSPPSSTPSRSPSTPSRSPSRSPSTPSTPSRSPSTSSASSSSYTSTSPEPYNPTPTVESKHGEDNGDDFGRYLPDDDEDDADSGVDGVRKLTPSRTTVRKSSAPALSRVLQQSPSSSQVAPAGWARRARSRSEELSPEFIEIFNQTLNRRAQHGQTKPRPQNQPTLPAVYLQSPEPKLSERRFEKNNNHQWKVNQNMSKSSSVEKKSSNKQLKPVELGTVNFSFVKYQNLDRSKSHLLQHNSVSNLNTNRGNSAEGDSTLAFHKYDGFDGVVPHPLDLETILTSEGTCKNRHHPHLWNKMKQGLGGGAGSGNRRGSAAAYPGMEHFTFSELSTATPSWAGGLT